MAARGSKGYKNWFALADSPPDAPVKAVGAYRWLLRKGYNQVQQIKDHFKSDRYTQVTHRRRVMVSGLLYDKGLLEEFLDECWTDKHNPSRQERKSKMNGWIQEYRNDYQSGYHYLIK